jgi:hypothetical protein
MGTFHCGLCQGYITPVRNITAQQQQHWRTDVLANRPKQVARPIGLLYTPRHNVKLHASWIQLRALLGPFSSNCNYEHIRDKQINYSNTYYKTNKLGQLSYIDRRTHKRELKNSSAVRHPCGGGVEYPHRDPATRRRRWKEKSQIWDSKIRPQVPRD